MVLATAETLSSVFTLRIVKCINQKKNSLESTIAFVVYKEFLKLLNTLKVPNRKYREFIKQQSITCKLHLPTMTVTNNYNSLF